MRRKVSLFGGPGDGKTLYIIKPVGQPWPDNVHINDPDMPGRVLHYRKKTNSRWYFVDYAKPPKDEAFIHIERVGGKIKLSDPTGTNDYSDMEEAVQEATDRGVDPMTAVQQLSVDGKAHITLHDKIDGTRNARCYAPPGATNSHNPEHPEPLPLDDLDKEFGPPEDHSDTEVPLPEGWLPATGAENVGFGQAALNQITGGTVYYRDLTDDTCHVCTLIDWRGFQKVDSMKHQAKLITLEEYTAWLAVHTKHGRTKGGSDLS